MYNFQCQCGSKFVEAITEEETKIRKELEIDEFVIREKKCEKCIIRTKIGVSRFAYDRYFTKYSGKTQYNNSVENLIGEICNGWSSRKPGFGRTNLEEVVLVPINPESCTGTTITVNSRHILKAKIDQRQVGEDEFISVEAVGEKFADQFGDDFTPNIFLNNTDKCNFANVVLYNKSILTADELSGCEDKEWVVVAIVASPIENEPPPPLTMARNFLNKPGGTFAPYTAEQFAESIYYWSKRCSVGKE